jgi:hypothetical protein
MSIPAQALLTPFSMRTTMTGVFRQPDGALRASERLSELACVGSLRLFLPGADGTPIETMLVEERSPWLRLTLFGAAIGFLCAYVALSITPSWALAIVALATGAGGGALLGSWLGGQRYRRTVRPHMRLRYLDLVRRGRAIVLADVRTHHDAEEVRSVMEECGAYVSEGHWPVSSGGSSNHMQPA